MATIRSVPPSSETRIPVSTGRVSSREAAFATRSMVAASAPASSCTAVSPAVEGSFGKSAAGSVRTENDARCDVTFTTPWSEAASIETVSPSATRTMSSKQPRRQQQCAFLLDASPEMLDWSASSVSVADRPRLSPDAFSITPPRAGIAERVAAARVTSWSSDRNGCLSTENFIQATPICMNRE